MAAGEGRPITVLHVEDDPGFAEVTATGLEREGDDVRVVTESTAGDALEYLAANPEAVDCVLSDYKLPDADGLDLLDTVREIYGDLPFVLLTGRGSEAVASEAIAAGVTDYIRKDASGESHALLANRIRNAVQIRRTRTRQRRLLEAIETAQEGISILDEDGRYLFVNRAYADLYGYDPEEMVGSHWELVYREEDVTTITEELLPKIDGEGYWHGETTGLRADGTTFVEDHVVSRTDRGELVCIVRDVSDRKARKQELRLKNRAMDEAPVGIIIADASRPDNPVVYANDHFETLTGYTPEEVLGRNCRFLQGEATDPDAVAEMRAAIENNYPVTVELRNYRKDGTEFWNRVTIAPVGDETGRVTHYIGFQEDVTGRKEPIRQLRVLHRVLRHNLTNQLSVVRGTAEQLASDASGPEHATPETIIEEVDRLLEIIDSHREIVRLLSERPTPHRLDLAATVDRAVEAVRKDHPGAVVDVEGPDCVVVQAIPAVERALQELLTNAIVYSDREPPAVELTLEDGDRTARVRIADHGPGIPEAEARILRGDQDVGPLSHGLGMGLWLVYWIVTLSNGTITIENRSPLGTTIVVELPVRDRDRP